MGVVAEVEWDEDDLDIGVDALDLIDNGADLVFAATGQDDGFGLSIGKGDGGLGSEAASAGTCDED